MAHASANKSDGFRTEPQHNTSDICSLFTECPRNYFYIMHNITQICRVPNTAFSQRDQSMHT